MSTKLSTKLIENLTYRALYYSTQMIHQANNRSDVEKGDPKIGGHPAACASSTHILGALHLLVKTPFDYLAVKPHASPMDHSYAHLLGMFTHADGTAFTEEQAEQVMFKLRKFMDPSDPNSEPAFQSYHAAWDPDAFNFFPSGSVGIPPVVSAYTALAYRFAQDHGFAVPKDAHFWSLMGDSEFREGSLAECMPDVAERQLSNVTWIVDYNRQNLDGTRIINEEGIHGTDADRIERMARANGWDAIQVRHGKKRQAAFQQAGDRLRIVIENLSDFELQALLIKNDGKVIRNRLIELSPELKSALGKFKDQEILEIFKDLGGHDIFLLAEIFEACKKSKMPTLVIAHTIKGWGIEGLEAVTGNHSMLANDNVVEQMRVQQNIPTENLFQRFPANSPEGQYCSKRGQLLRDGMNQQKQLKAENLEKLKQNENWPVSFDINLKLSPWANTQWMWGQLATKLIRIANTKNTDELKDDEKNWVGPSKYVLTMAPDVGTSTNLNPNMDGKVYGPDTTEDFEEIYHVKDKRRPDLLPLEKEVNRHLRFEIEEANAMSCLGAFGKMKDHLGIPFLPLMTVYDFFIKRALDQYFYNVYWKSNFILVGTPSGVTLSPEGAQHSWKSDLQIPNGITWEPAFAQEMDWILADAVQRHFTNNNYNREGVLIRAVTRGIEQKQMLENLRKQKRLQDFSDEQILETTRQHVLEGGYWLVHYEGSEGYAPGDNVVHLFAMGALVTEAVKASELLLEQGIFANVCVVTSPDLLIGNLGRDNQYTHLKNTLNVNANLYLNSQRTLQQGDSIQSMPEMYALRGSRIPIIAVCDGEPGLLDNIGSIIGVPQDTLAIRKHSKSGRPSDVYRYHHMDAESIQHSAWQILEQATTEEIHVSKTVVNSLLDSQETDFDLDDTNEFLNAHK